MTNYSKAIGAAVGGALTGAAAGPIVLPDGSPWYAYILLAVVTTVLPVLITYFAPANK